MNKVNLKKVVAAVLFMFLFTACSKKLMPPEISSSNDKIDSSELTASNTTPSKDEKLGPIVRRVGPCTMRITKDPYQTLVEAIIYQQLSEASATAITKRFLKIYGKFPTPKRVVNTSDNKLKGVGLSGTKINYIKGLSKQIISKEIDFKKISKLDNEQVTEE